MRNQQMFNDIADIIELNPSMHKQELFMTGHVGDRVVVTSHGAETVMCGTTQCVAGWAATLSDEYTIASGFVQKREGKKLSGTTWERAGADVLGLTETEANQIFFHMATPPMGWPDALRAIGAGADIHDALRDTIPRCEAD